MKRFDLADWRVAFMAVLLIFSLPMSAFAQATQDFDFFEWSAAEDLELPQDIRAALVNDPNSRLLLTGPAPNQDSFLISNGEVRTVTLSGGSPSQRRTWSLPEGVQSGSAALHAGLLYLATPNPSPALWVLDPAAPSSDWQEAAVLPDANVGEVHLSSQGGRLFALSETAAATWDINADKWTVLTPAPEALNNWTSVSAGSAHILFFNRAEAQTRFLVYHVITDQWFYSELQRAPIQVLSAVSGGPGFTLLSANEVTRASLTQPQLGLTMIDYAIIIGLLGSVFLIGLLFSRSSKSTQDYFRSSRAIPWWAAALSIFATSASAITVMAMPAMSFAGNWNYLSIAIYLLIIQIPLYTFIYVPIIRKLNFPSANQYLENRFGLSVRFLGFLGFSLNQILGRGAAILLLPAVAINAIFGLPIIHSILLMGLCTTIFVAMGGFEAVVWTDVLLAVIMVSAIVVSLIFAVLGVEATFSESVDLVQRLDKMAMFDLRLDLSAPVALILFLNSFVTSLGYIGDQNFVQRVQSTKTQKGAKLAAVSQLGVAVPLNFVLFSLGTVLFLYYTSTPQVISPAMPPDGIYPFFAATVLPPGLAGLVVTALLAATISTVSSALSSVSNVVVEDLYRRLNANATDRGCLRLGRWLTVFLGLFATGTALILASLGGLQSIWDLFLTITGLIVGPITGAFVLGIFSRRTNAFGVWSGVVASVAANFVAKTYFDLHSTVFLSVGVFTCIFVGYLASWLAPAPRNDLTGLTLSRDKKL